MYLIWIIVSFGCLDTNSFIFWHVLGCDPIWEIRRLPFYSEKAPQEIEKKEDDALEKAAMVEEEEQQTAYQKLLQTLGADPTKKVLLKLLFVHKLT